MKIRLKVDEFFVRDKDGEVYDAVTIQEFKKKEHEKIRPTKEQSYFLVPMYSDDDDSYLKIENRNEVEFASKLGTLIKVIRPK